MVIKLCIIPFSPIPKTATRWFSAMGATYAFTKPVTASLKFRPVVGYANLAHLEFGAPPFVYYAEEREGP